uniref:3-dehydrosphinganine reductase n=1 Tax=Meloidogyne enterolobii TaxID=390850 RepID=A0A6V7UIX4_MELEN|nr:unnamed protein product [Meloidogyne enterolobii]
MKNKKKKQGNIEKGKLYKLVMNLEFDNPTENENFKSKDYEGLVDSAIKRVPNTFHKCLYGGSVLGEAAPLYQFLSYDVATKRGTPQECCLSIYFLPGRLLFVIEGKHAVITGGSKGIGRCIAEQLLEEGCKIVSIIARDLEALEKAKKEILQLGFEEDSVKIYSCDLNSGQKIIKDLIEKIIADSGPIDLLINNAGTCIQNSFDELPEDAFEKQMKTNFFSAVYMTRAILPQMKERRCGHISFVSSAAGQCAIWGYSAYSPSKFAVRAFADVLYMELLPYEIGVSVLFPPNTATEGFDEELKNMPEQVRQISNSAGVFPLNKLPQH